MSNSTETTNQLNRYLTVSKLLNTFNDASGTPSTIGSRNSAAVSTPDKAHIGLQHSGLFTPKRTTRSDGARGNSLRINAFRTNRELAFKRTVPVVEQDRAQDKAEIAIA